MRLSKIEEATMGSAEYGPPSKAPKLMADFYSVEYLSTMVNDQHSADLARELSYVKSQLLPYLKKHLLEMVGYSICCELRHAFDKTEECAAYIGDLDCPKCGGEDACYCVEEYMAENPYMEPGQAYVAIYLSQYLDEDQVMMLFRCCQVEQQPRFSAVLPHIRECVEAGSHAFSELSWAEYYGSSAWSDACRLWKRLFAAGSERDVVVAADMIYQAQHNTGSLLNKNPEYQGQWLGFMLNLKYAAKEPEELLTLASGYVRRLGGFIVKNSQNRGMDGLMPTENAWTQMLDRATSVLRSKPWCQKVFLKINPAAPDTKIVGFTSDRMIGTITPTEMLRGGSKGHNAFCVEDMMSGRGGFAYDDVELSKMLDGLQNGTFNMTL